MNITTTNKEFIWAQKYRPDNIQECVLPKAIKAIFLRYANEKDFPHLLLTSQSPGTGKTTVARALCNQVGASVLFLNASTEGRIDVVREKVHTFSSSASLMGGMKVVLLDEFDQASKDAQKALRAMMEEFSATTRFILTANYKQNVIEPIRSRCINIEFTIGKDEQPLLMKEMFMRCCEILKLEDVQFDQKVLIKVIGNHFPDNRAILTKLHEYAGMNDNVIDEGIFAALDSQNVGELIKTLKEKDFKAMRQWVADNSNTFDGSFYMKLYNGMYEKLKGLSKAEYMITLAEYQKTHAQCVCTDVHIAGMLTEFMMGCEWV